MNELGEQLMYNNCYDLAGGLYDVEEEDEDSGSGCESDAEKLSDDEYTKF